MALFVFFNFRENDISLRHRRAALLASSTSSCNRRRFTLLRRLAAAASHYLISSRAYLKSVITTSCLDGFGI
ncbi:hypothetical protein LWI28_017244 [Acer negundo]|uniref:Uncharacterized protein n=1 Tax=Acer negundo TaxID=4023 RepID=A0AAD5P5X2_ACENE|nr:hypothetical protein LWI28_017244 [Acer negundo]